MIAIINYGLGNVCSIHNMLKKLRIESVISSDLEQIRAADKFILPGVGAFDEGIIKLRASGLLEVLEEQILANKKAVLGICLGMQMLTNGSEEGKKPGLGWINAFARKFEFSNFEKKLPIPHMGWNIVESKDTDLLFNGLIRENRFYFVHSFFVECVSEENILASCQYGNKFTCSIFKDNIFGVQFHPEKSHKFGMKLLENFASISNDSK